MRNYCFVRGNIMKEKWIVTNKKHDFEKLNHEVKINPLIARLLVNRGISTRNDMHVYLKGTIDDLHDGTQMKDMQLGVSIIKNAIEENKKIVIYGDYDCDGVSSTTILYKTLKELGADFKYYIPDREEEGYGINSNRIKILKEEGFEVILTCDNGIAAMEQVKLAKELGMTIVVTDHHDIPYIIENDDKKFVVPEADAVINPKQHNCSYPFKDLCGAGIALKFSKCLLEAMGKSFENHEELFQYAAIATVCDVVTLQDENRIILKKGLEIINSTNNIGLKALLDVTGLNDKQIGEYHFGFILGPIINATGRLETANLSVELLITESEEKAKELAKKLFELNKIRQDLTSESVERILNGINIHDNERVILVYDENIHESIAGIVAGRVREKYNLPTIILTKGKDMPKGSCRSIEGYNMFEELNKCKDLIDKFGGHPMAAGLSVEEKNIPLLRKALIEKCELTKNDIIPIVRIDSPCPIEGINEELVEKIEKLRPFGKGNSSPLLAAKNVNVKRMFFIGKDKNFMKFRFTIDGGYNKYVEGINFDKYDEFKELYVDKFGEEEFLKLLDTGYCNFNMDITYYPSINEFNGNRSIQLNIKNIRL